MIAQPKAIRLLLASLLLGAGGCSWDDAVEVAASDRAPETRSPAPRTTASAVAADVALGQTGRPYRYGGSSPSGFDCSGLVQYAYNAAGKATPRTTSELFRATEAVGRRSLRRGDLVFFEIDGKMAHVGIYLDNDHFVHAPRSGRTVSVESLKSGFYKSRFVRGGRFVF